MLKMQKYQGFGNDYLILNPKENELKLEEKQISFLCRRNFGIGADGILYGNNISAFLIRMEAKHVTAGTES